MQSLPTTSKPDSIAATRKMRWWYEALADFMLANPSARQNDIAVHFKRSASTISVILNTDAFKAYYRQRRAEYQGDLTGTINTKLMNVVDLSLDVMLEKLEKKRDTLPLDQIQRVNDSALKALGYGQSGPAVVVQQNNNVHNTTTIPVSVGLADLEAARTALRNAQQTVDAPPMIDVTPEPNAALGRGATDTSHIEDLA